ncbi:amidohydrolase [Streptomyces coffeae]|uniref:Amidohydrolase n=1 Tax=Streptomyces coffeae TaxID=621382 RepID=A0ABS1NBE6_9ACTN|nr:amidohydrolase [Streptomyces coffeae]MBL1097400.1 amidohydrolase [Streptomyces coffeae]
MSPHPSRQPHQTASQEREVSRRRVVAGLTGAGAALATRFAVSDTAAAAPGTAGSRTDGTTGHADTVLLGGRITTLDPRHPDATALAVQGSRIQATGTDHRIRALIGPQTQVIHLGGRRVIPGLNDSHTHLVRQGLSYTQELSLAGVRSVSEALRLIAFQAARTPAPQWVRVVGGFSRFQFAERRLPTLDELNAAVPDTPVFLLHLYDRALLNRTALRVLGFGKDTPDLPGSQIERDAAGHPTGMLIAKPNATLLYSTLARLPRLDPESRTISTRHYLRHLNARGVTSVIDAGGGHQTFPDDYEVINRLHREDQLTVRVGYHTFTQAPGKELADFQRIAELVTPGDGDDHLRMIGAGEMLVYSAADFEDFAQPRPELAPAMEGQLRDVLSFLAEKKWPFRLHATYDQSITRFLDVIEQVHGPGGPGVRFILDHAETISEPTIDRVARLGGAIALQHRMAFQGELFRDRYGARAAAHTPPVNRILRAGVPVGLGTDATRVASDNVWNALYWITTGRTVGGERLYPAANRLDRIAALRLMTQGSAWLSHEDTVKGMLGPGHFADLAVLSDDYLTVPASRIPALTSVLTLVGGRVVYAAAEHARLDPALPPVQPAYSPLVTGANTL